MIARHANREYDPPVPGDHLGTIGLRPRAIGTKWEIEGTAERSNAGIGSLRMGLHGVVRGDGAITRRRGVGGRVIR